MRRQSGHNIDGLRVGQARTALAMTQQELADRAEIHRVTLAKIEAGTQRVSLDVLERLSAALDRTREWLLGEPEEVDPIELARERMANAMSKIADGFEDFQAAVTTLEERARLAGDREAARA